MSKPSPTLAGRAAGALVGLAAGRRLALGDAPDGGLAMARILADELAAGRRDLRELARRWVAWHQAHPAAVDPETGAALVHVARHDEPPAGAAGQGTDPLIRALPVALAAFDAPRTLVSASYHIVALTHPDPVVAWAAVAVNVAVARFLAGKRDFVPEVLELLRANEAPAPVVEALRRVPLLAGAAHAAAAPTAPLGSALGNAEAALRLAYYEPLLERGLQETAKEGVAGAGQAGLAGALLGAREGLDAIPAAWTTAPAAAELADLAARLVRAPAPVER